MRKLIRSAVAAVVLIAMFGIVPGQAVAVGYEDSLDDCAYPKPLDAVVLRPLGFLTIVGAGTIAALSAPFYPLFPKDIGKFWHAMVVPPTQFTFSRSLGECSTGGSGY
jgi:hypothetical protein